MGYGLGLLHVVILSICLASNVRTCHGGNDVVGHKGLAFAENDIVCIANDGEQECGINPCLRHPCDKCSECFVRI